SALGGGASDMSQLSWPTPPVPGVPAVVRDQLVLPYLAGRDFARAVQEKGGWEALKAAWSAPPASMEQVLHPEKFFAREPARAVTIRYAPPKGQLLSEGVLGELLTRTFLAGGREEGGGALFPPAFLAAGSEEGAPAAPRGAPAPPTVDEVERAAAGWGGDAY